MNRKLHLGIFLFWAVVFIGVYFMLCNEAVYSNSWGILPDNWVRENDTPIPKSTHMTAPTNQNIIQWDAVHYHRISEHDYEYDKSSEGSDYIFAFFPLFPYLWKVSTLPPLGITLLNYLLFAVSFLILQGLVSGGKRPGLTQILLALSLPSIVIYIIPYSEAVFMFTVTLGLFGLIRKKYALYFLGFFLAALTRPAYTFLFLSVVGVELFQWLNHRNTLQFLKSIFLRILPLILGTLLVVILQWNVHHESFFKFIEVQKYWKNEFQIPKQLSDWSNEGFSINVGVTWIVALPLLLLLISAGFKQLRKRIAIKYATTTLSLKDYMMWLSVFFTVGSFLFIILFRGGSLHCLFRFTICTPFFFVLFIYGFDYIRQYPWFWRLGAVCVLTLAAIMMLHNASYAEEWIFSDFGFFILSLVLLLWVLQDYERHRWYRWSLFLVCISNLYWTAFLLNAYLNNGWIFA